MQHESRTQKLYHKCTGFYRITEAHLKEFLKELCVELEYIEFYEPLFDCPLLAKFQHAEQSRLVQVLQKTFALRFA